MKHGKKYLDSAKLIQQSNYEPEEAIDLALQTAKAKFDETLEVSVRLGVDPRHADQQVRGTVVLPNGTGRTVRVLVFAKGDNAKAAEAATPDMMGVVGRLGRVLGPKGLMPNPKSGTVTTDVARAIAEIKAGKVEYRVDRTAIVHVPFGKVSFGKEKLGENFRVLMDAIVKAKPAAAKGTYVRSVVISTTMGPGVKLNAARFVSAAPAAK